MTTEGDKMLKKTFPKFFTPQEANQTLPLVQRIVDDILEKGRELHLMTEQYRGGELPKDCSRLETEIHQLAKELEELGCYFKDWNFQIGLVDFPAVIDDEEVFLCWRSDEESVSWYHTLESDYTHRQPIPENLLVS